MIEIKLDYSYNNIENFFNIVLSNNSFLKEIKSIYTKYFSIYTFYRDFELDKVYYENDEIVLNIIISSIYVINNEKLTFLPFSLFKEKIKKFILDLINFLEYFNNNQNCHKVDINKTDNKLYLKIRVKVSPENFIKIFKLDNLLKRSQVCYTIKNNNFFLKNTEEIFNKKEKIKKYTYKKIETTFNNNNEKYIDIAISRDFEMSIKRKKYIIDILGISGKTMNNKFLSNLTIIIKNKNDNNYEEYKIKAILDNKKTIKECLLIIYNNNNKQLYNLIKEITIEDINYFVKNLVFSFIAKKKVSIKKSKIYNAIEKTKIISLLI